MSCVALPPNVKMSTPLESLLGATAVGVPPPPVATAVPVRPPMVALRTRWYEAVRFTCG